MSRTTSSSSTRSSVSGRRRSGRRDRAPRLGRGRPCPGANRRRKTVPRPGALSTLSAPAVAAHDAEDRGEAEAAAGELGA